MKRRNLFEFEDLPWFPGVVREGGTDFLRFFLNTTRFYDPVVPLLSQLCDAGGQRHILDLCSGGGGGITRVASLLQKEKQNLKVILSDKFPNERFRKYFTNETTGLAYLPYSVNAMNVPAEIEGVVTMFSAIHHFSPDQISGMLQQLTSQKRHIAFFDGGDKSWLTIAGILLVQPLIFLLCTPLIKPFHAKRLLYTYLLPAIPLMTVWDGISSIFRLYTADELLQIATQTAPTYHWKTGYLNNRIGMKIVYLTGNPS